MAHNTKHEDETIPFFKNNSVAVPSGVRTISHHGGKKQPVIEKTMLLDVHVGKKDDGFFIVRGEGTEIVYLDNSYNGS